MRSHPGKTLTIYDLPSSVKECWPRVATPVNIVHGFKVSGVHPFNRDVFHDDEFAPSSVTDRPDPTATETPSEPTGSNALNVNNHGGNQIQTNNTGEISTESENAGNKCTSSNAWDKLDAYARNLNRLVIRVPGHGHCLLHAVRKSLAEENIEDLSHDQICFKLRNEIIVNRGYYADFAGDRDIVNGIENYITKKEFNNETIDLVLAALCNSFGVSAILYQCIGLQNDVQIFAHAPGREHVAFRGDIHISKNGQDGNAHYNCIGRCIHQANNVNEVTSETSTETTEISSEGMPRFSPEHIRPHPKAHPKKSTTERKKRRQAILTDTPEKNSIEEEYRRRQQKNKKEKKQQSRQNTWNRNQKPNQLKGNQRQRNGELKVPTHHQMKNGIV